MNIITPSEVVEYAFTLREEISPISIKPVKIDVAAERFVRPRFGDELYEKFAEGDYAPYVEEYVKPALAHYIRYMMVDELSIQLTDSGAVVFENEDLRSQHNKIVADIASGKSVHTGSDTVSSQQIVDTKKTHDDNILKTSENESKEHRGTDEDVHTVGKKMDNETLKREYNTKTEDSKSKTNDSTQTGSDILVGEQIKDRDYEYHESPKTVGISTIGVSHDVNKDERKSTVSKIDSGTSSENSSTEVDHLLNDSKINKGESDVLTDKHISLSIANESAQTVNEANVGEEIVKQQNTGNRSVEIHKDITQNSERKSLDDGSAQTSRNRMKPATDSQRRIIRARALADANILMSKAVRYVERHADIFPEYEPMPRSFGRIVL